mmetsp:Transcript_1286/g.1817  ORF Transcript_1286/g.1817 Transcript_1286/m.1817 type:complete len:208 (-) Transcript_1286:474-1097(-)
MVVKAKSIMQIDGLFNHSGIVWRIDGTIGRSPYMVLLVDIGVRVNVTEMTSITTFTILNVEDAVDAVWRKSTEEQIQGKGIIEIEIHFGISWEDDAIGFSHQFGRVSKLMIGGLSMGAKDSTCQRRLILCKDKECVIDGICRTKSRVKLHLGRTGSFLCIIEGVVIGCSIRIMIECIWIPPIFSQFVGILTRRSLYNTPCTSLTEWF